jgi:uncharacterized protein (DUF1501 family)
MDRRTFVRGMCMGGLATFAAPYVAFARVPGKERFVFVLLRGGFDGLAAVVPVGDPGYASLRGAMAYSRAQLTSLSDVFSLAPGLSPLRSFWDAGELAAVHAMAIPYRTRSHFDGQAVLETGLAGPNGAADGWLNRLLQVMEGERAGIAVAAGLPRSLSGSHPVLTWSPSNLGSVEDAYLEHLHLLYRSDPLLFDRFEAALQLQAGAMGTQAMEAQGMEGGEMIAGEMVAPGEPPARLQRADGRISSVMQAVARFLRDPEGPNVAAAEFSGWDTHANQGLAGGALDRLFAQLSDGLTTFRSEMGADWPDTTVVVMTEFGRTARPNGSGGTDHGTAGAGFVLSPKLSRSTILSDWPGLSTRDLFEGRDLRPTLDTRSILKTALQGTFDLTASQVERVFPGSESVRPVTGFMA